MLREYVVTLHKYEDLESFYEDMETPGGTAFIPDRAVQLTQRRFHSRNTNYMLTDEEAEIIKQDSRVKNVTLTMNELGLKFENIWTQTSTGWSKSSVSSSTFNNWGILRCIEGLQRSNWGADGTTTVSGTVTGTASGKHVDVVIVDGHINPDHPEFAVNPNGTGGSRVQQFNWFSLIPQVTGGSSSTYVYTPYVDPSYPDIDGNGISDRTDDNDHGAHVAGTVAGNTQGWARDANIYNISPYGSNQNSSNLNYTIDNFIEYIKVWHRNKPVNPVTGIKNPTITNHSYGINQSVTITNITSVRYKGIIYSGPFSPLQLANYGITNNGTITFTPRRYGPVEDDFIDLIAEGIIVVGASGNNYVKIANPSNDIADDYNNYYATSSQTYYYNRGTTTAAEGVIVVGAVSALVNETKLESTNCGPRVDIYAPGENILSSINSTTGSYATDSRNGSYTLAKKSGTSMASPQVAGILACILETWPRASQSQLIQHLNNYAKAGQLTDTLGGPTDYTDLQGSDNKYLFFFKERKDDGFLTPKNNLGTRPSTGMIYPRPRVFRYGS